MSNDKRTIDVLIIDDEKHFLTDLAEGLRFQSGKMNIVTADSGQKALEVLRTILVDVVITDVNMPGIDGFEAVRRINELRPGVPVILMSAYARASVDDRLEGLPYADYLEKPLDLGEVAGCILKSA